MNDKKENTTGNFSRRAFLHSSALGVAATVAGKNVIFAAPAQRTIRVGLLGCGGRGNGALEDCIAAAKNLNINLDIVATADWFKNKAIDTGSHYGIPEDRCFSGADAYKKLLETNIDVMLTAAPPGFRPVHFEAAIKTGKHVFMEKPVAVDPPGVRKIIDAGELAKSKGLSVVAGTQRRHQSNYRRTAHAVHQGAIGDFRGGCVWWCGGIPWIKRRSPGENDSDYMVRNWLNFVELSGDHIVEQHVHNLDVANWFIGHPPLRALGFGGRAQRETGNQYDFFDVQYDYADDLYIHSMCRQINGCYVRVMEHFIGSCGSTKGDGSDMKACKEVRTPEFPEYGGAYVQEHIDLLSSILKNEPINEARNVAESTLTAIMGRISAYTGQIVRWSDLIKNENHPLYNLTLKPTADDFEKGPVVAPADDVTPIPGKKYQS